MLEDSAAVAKKDQMTNPAVWVQQRLQELALKLPSKFSFLDLLIFSQSSIFRAFISVTPDKSDAIGRSFFHPWAFNAH